MENERQKNHSAEIWTGITAVWALLTAINLSASADYRDQARAYAESGQIQLLEEYNNKANTSLNLALLDLLVTGTNSLVVINRLKERNKTS